MSEVQIPGRKIIAIGLGAQYQKDLPALLGLRPDVDQILFSLWYKVREARAGAPADVVVFAAKHGENPTQLRGRVKEERFANRNNRNAKIVLIAFAGTDAANAGADAVVKDPTIVSLAEAIRSVMPSLEPAAAVANNAN